MIRRLPAFSALAFVALTFLLGLPAGASAFPPATFANGVGTTGTSTALFLGWVNAGNNATKYQVEYDLLSSEWCTSHGASGSPANSTPPTDLGFTDNAVHDVSVGLTGLTADVEYCAGISATNVEGQYASGQVTWWQGQPEVDTTGASVTGQTTATVEGQINPHHQNLTYHAAYGPASSEWCTSSGASGTFQTADSVVINSGDDAFHAASINLVGLTLGTEYCAALVTNSGYDERVYGPQVTWTESLPDADTYDTYSTGVSTATVEGDLNSGGDSTTTYEVQYDLAGSDWCTSGGDSGSPSHTSPTDAGSADTNYHFVSADLTGLSAGMSYCAQLTATNPAGEADGGLVAWTQGTPTPETFDAFATGDSTATIEGDVNPAGQSTTYRVEYDVIDSDWCQSNGASGSPAHTTAATSLGFTDGVFHNVSVGLSGLAGGESYCGQLIASNSTGGSEGGLVGWDQPAPTHFTLTVSVQGSGSVTSSPAGINCSSTCASTFAAGTQVTLTAKPTASAPVSWTGCTSIGPSSFLICHVTLNENTSVGVTFSSPPPPPKGPVTVELAGDGAGTVTSSPAGIDCGSTCSGQFSTASQVTLTATAASGSTFEGWSYPGCSTGDPCSVQPLLLGTVTVTATFDRNPAPPKIQCIVPRLKGKKLAAAKTALRQHHCGVGKITKVKSPKRNRGRVISQKPKPGKHLRKGAKIALKIGK